MHHVHCTRLIQPDHRGSLAATTCSLRSQLTTSAARAPHLVRCTRTMQTAVGAFGGEATAVGIDVPPLMAENMGNSNRPAISSLNCPPFIAVELCQEDMGIHPCDRRRSISEYKSMFPAIDFSLNMKRGPNYHLPTS
ncbi:phosphoglycerate mutase-like protein isoform X2 [Helianthus annuus]|uniref:phosphoglycerate mutase-like protein isoform X2 n=1 Tax=Helianthus annuus TaxID=4232 RepID=UPI000B8EFB0B|nr:phosphoglycerate mutase-like protein isoform X2 [Helianthus annuus]